MKAKTAGLFLFCIVAAITVTYWVWSASVGSSGIDSQTTASSERSSGTVSALPPVQPKPEPASGSMTVRATYWCGQSFNDAGEVQLAVARGDSQALAGLLSRGNAFQVEGGTRVISGGEIEMGISLVHVESGFQAGRKCYISTRALE